MSRDMNTELKKNQAKNLVPAVYIEGAPNTTVEIEEPIDEKPIEDKSETKDSDNVKKDSQKPAEKLKSEEKPMVKKKVAKVSPKKAAKKVEDDFDDDFDDEGGFGVYAFWAVIVIIAMLLAMWIFTDWQLCVQF